MLFKGPRDTSQYHWTNHVKFKMQYYGLSAQKILGVISRPKRKEEGIVEKTIAVMQPVSLKIVNGKEIWKSEVWVMYQKLESRNLKLETKEKFSHDSRYKLRAARYKIISAWRYPGVSPKRNPIPEEILSEIVEII